MTGIDENINGQDAMRLKVHRWIFIAALSFLAIGLSASKAFLSIAELALGLNWIAEGNYAQKWKRFTSNKPALVLVSFYILHLIGMIYSTDYQFGLEDIRIKVPLLILPFMFCTSDALNERERNMVLGLYTGAITVVSFIGLYRLKHHSFIDIHYIIPFVSSIRLALMIVLSVFLLIGYVFSKKWNWISFLLIIWTAWLLIFLVIMESLTGIILSAIISLILVIYYAVQKIKQKQFLIGLVPLCIIIMVLGSAIAYVQISIISTFLSLINRNM